ncbi:hypothetical protein [Dactylosporangium sucinum]|uniref:Uncharacterized protein n=1 Tax=Dactylosporangium sucinum TaxID=1424081 RepID=A0A917U293_9ACTN|nr:hypothetical protein [Dactylosporangium sucinum]GGM52963.1 hypothetical protein GCM10007977_063210 [Dactylosporangium sucinum]
MHETGENDIKVLASIASPLERAVRLRALAKDRGTLSAAESALYRAAVAELRGNKERRRGWIAARLGVTPGAIDRLLRTKSKTAGMSGATDGVAA